MVRREERKEGPVETVKSRARKVSSMLLMLRVQRVKLEGPVKINITRKRKKGKEKRTDRDSVNYSINTPFSDH